MSFSLYLVERDFPLVGVPSKTFWTFFLMFVGLLCLGATGGFSPLPLGEVVNVGGVFGRGDSKRGIFIDLYLVESTACLSLEWWFGCVPCWVFSLFVGLENQISGVPLCKAR